MKVVRLFSDPGGVSHFEDIDIGLARSAYAPPAPSIDVSKRFAVSNAVLFSIPPGWFGDWHPTPVRQLYFSLSGRLEVAASDGEIRIFKPGDVVLVEDEVAPGHTTRAVGDAPATGAFVHLAAED